MRALFFIVPGVTLLLLVGCRGESSLSSEAPTSASAKECNPPANPYSAGTGHYAGFEWAERNDAGSCGGNSTSFVEGCEEYLRQSEEYQDCNKNE